MSIVINFKQSGNAPSNMYPRMEKKNYMTQWLFIKCESETARQKKRRRDDTISGIDQQQVECFSMGK